MDERQIRAILAMMNINAPEGTEWCAWQPGREVFADDYKIRDHWRFYLVEKDSKMHEDNSDNLLWGS